MYRAAARRVCRCHGMDRDEAQQPPPTCWLPHLATATGVGWLRSFWFSTPPAHAPGVSALRPGLRRWASSTTTTTSTAPAPAPPECPTSISNRSAKHPGAVTEIDTATQQRPAGHSPFESAVDHDAPTLYVTDDLTALSGFVENISRRCESRRAARPWGLLAAHLLTGTGHDGLEEFHRGWIELIAETGDGQGVEHADRATWIGNPLKLGQGPRVPQPGLEFHQFTEPACAIRRSCTRSLRRRDRTSSPRPTTPIEFPGSWHWSSRKSLVILSIWRSVIATRPADRAAPDRAMLSVDHFPLAVKASHAFRMTLTCPQWKLSRWPRICWTGV